MKKSLTNQNEIKTKTVLEGVLISIRTIILKMTKKPDRMKKMKNLKPTDLSKKGEKESKQTDLVKKLAVKTWTSNKGR